MFPFVPLCVEMEDSKRQAYIKQQDAAKKKQKGSLPPKAMDQVNPSTKRKPSGKVDHPPKKPQVLTGPNVGETPAKLPLKPGPRMGKGLMKGHVPFTKEHPVLLCEDSSYVLK